MRCEARIGRSANRKRIPHVVQQSCCLTPEYFRIYVLCHGALRSSFGRVRPLRSHPEQPPQQQERCCSFQRRLRGRYCCCGRGIASTVPLADISQMKGAQPRCGRCVVPLDLAGQACSWPVVAGFGAVGVDAVRQDGSCPRMVDVKQAADACRP
jgi:hypothetical protein